MTVLSKESREAMSAKLPEVATKLKLLDAIKKTLVDQTIKKFHESFEARDKQGLVMCIQVFFNLEILSD